jgi:quercetin dioxygenase-like cupin family protein
MKQFKDKRGIIKDIMVGDGKSVTFITFKKGAIRGNHVHKKTTQIDIVLKGKLFSKVSLKGHVNLTPNSTFPEEAIMKKGDFMHIPAKVPHVYEALEDSEILSICFGVRVGEDYGKDTYEHKLL